jgi:hypothetical protein
MGKKTDEPHIQSGGIDKWKRKWTMREEAVTEQEMKLIR